MSASPYMLVQSSKGWAVMSHAQFRFVSKDKSQAEEVFRLAQFAFSAGQESVRAAMRDLLNVPKAENNQP